MKRPVLAALAAVLALSNPHSAEARPSARRESGRVGNGGFAYVCRDAGGAITEAKLLDLWEAENLATWAKSDAVDAQIAVALAKLKEYSVNAWTNASPLLAELREGAVYSRRALNATEDAFPAYRPAPGCGYEQVARFEPVVTETGRQGLRVNSEIFQSPAFSNSDRAALFVHEAIYLLDRDHNEATNSQRSRMIVAHLFSDSVIPNAVRLATAALLGTKITIDVDAEGKRTRIAQNILAVRDPLAVAYAVRFDTVDGIAGWNFEAKASSAQKAALYRCTAGYGPSGDATTGWVKLAELVRESPFVYPRPIDGVKIDGTLRAADFDPEFGGRPGATMQTFLAVRCERKDAQGKIRHVAFDQAQVAFPETADLRVLGSGALDLSSGTTERTLKSNAKREQFGELPVSVVRGTF